MVKRKPKSVATITALLRNMMDQLASHSAEKQTELYDLAERQREVYTELREAEKVHAKLKDILG